MKIPEILAPGGGFNRAIHAYEAGADAVYAGMDHFSARKGAANFTLSQLRRLKTYVEKNNRKIYIAINTIIKHSELNDVINLIYRLNELKVDGIILQDTGLAYIMAKHFPHLEMHASTQMAVHNSQGVEFLKKSGFRRIILARELSLNEIEKIRKDHRDVELEVFIHGAMCYSFSGICLASGQLLGRSGNRGECGQICRTWFDGKEKHKFPFSANDMKAGETVLKLADIGIDSLKIEGRLKSPEYVFHTVGYYKSLFGNSSPKEARREEVLSSIAFSRVQTSAFFNTPKGTSMTSKDFASHRGVPAGTVLSSGKGQFLLKSVLPLAERDGLLLFLDGEPHQFALKSSKGKHRFKQGEAVPVFFNKKVPPGTAVSLVSRHDMALKEYREESWKSWKMSVPITLELNSDSLSATAKLNEDTFTYSEPVTIENSRDKKNILPVFQNIFSKSGDPFYRAEAIQLINKSSLPENYLFIPLSQLKKFRQNFFKTFGEWADALYSRLSEEVLETIDKEWENHPYYKQGVSIPDRSAMTARDKIIPFGSGPNNFYPLPPLQFSENDFPSIVQNIESLLKTHKGHVIVGVNNPGHFYLVKKFKQNERVLFFTDYCSYIANKAAGLYYKNHIDRLLFSYYWLEDKKGELPPMQKVDKEFNPHLFVSRICYRLHNNYGTCQNCKKDYHYTLKQRDKDFSVVVKDCLTWLFQKR